MSVAAAHGVGSSTRLSRVHLVNYRSIEECDVRLGPLTFLVGPNGAGKSNFMDALRLVSEALTTSLDQALRERSGFREIRRRSTPRGHPVSIQVQLQLATHSATYRLDLDVVDRDRYSVVREECRVRADYDVEAPEHFFLMVDGVLESDQPALPAPPPGRLYLVTAANLPAFTAVFDVLSRMAFYNLSPDAIRTSQPPDSGEQLTRDGRNMASVIERMQLIAPAEKSRVEQYLSVIVPGLDRVGVSRSKESPLETLRFEQRVGRKQPWTFHAHSVSDGTLRALGVLVAAFQPAGRSQVSLVGIEEPEAAVHPAAAAVLRDALDEASLSRQILVTTHSPELLDDPDLDPHSVVAVETTNGLSTIGHLDSAGLSVLRDKLYTAGELLRIGQLLPSGGRAAS